MTSESVAHLQARLAVVESRVRALVASRRTGDPNPEDPFRGLYISDDQVDEILASLPDAVAPGVPEAELVHIESRARELEEQGAELRLRRLERAFGLDGWEIEILLIALAPDLDSRFERLYAYLNDDVSRRRACLGLAMQLCGTSPREPGGAELLKRFHPESPLLRSGLMMVEETERPLLTRPLRVPDRVIAHLLGDDRPDPSIASFLAGCVPVEGAAVELAQRALESGVPLVYLSDRSGKSGLSVGVSAFNRAGKPALALDLAALDTPPELSEVVPVAVREAMLGGGGLVAGPIDALAGASPRALKSLAGASCPVILLGSRTWDPGWSARVPVLVEVPVSLPADRMHLWRQSLDGKGLPETELAAGTIQFRLSAEQIDRAATFARLRAAAYGRPISIDDVQAGARSQNAGALERLTRRVEPRAGWADLVLPAGTLAQLHELAHRARLSDRVMERWAGGSTRSRGVSALFAGDSGTGKTMSAEIVAGELGLDLYVIDLSTVIDKYIGETEKNLERIFVEADRVNAVLLFDEADAVFGKRSEVQDAHDRYANVETAYLLQRIERFEGLAILTTNLRSNVDEAFTRRLDAIVDFPEPDEEGRRQLWEVHLRRGMDPGPLDLDFLARSFRLSGGNISNIVLGAAFLATQEQSPVTMAHLIRATEREYRKLGHLCVPEEFGPYYPLIARV